MTLAPQTLALQTNVTMQLFRVAALRTLTVPAVTFALRQTASTTNANFQPLLVAAFPTVNAATPILAR
jgi:hypothetical protein